jgi:hypothetical protein
MIKTLERKIEKRRAHIYYSMRNKVFKNPE